MHSLSVNLILEFWTINKILKNITTATTKTTAATTIILSQVLNLPTNNESEEAGKNVYGGIHHQLP